LKSIGKWELTKLIEGTVALMKMYFCGSIFIKNELSILSGANGPSVSTSELLSQLREYLSDLSDLSDLSEISDLSDLFELYDAAMIINRRTTGL